jgi:hypothetical protein
MRIDPADLQRRGGRRSALSVGLDRRLAGNRDRGCPEGKADCGSHAATSETAVCLMIGHASVSCEWMRLASSRRTENLAKALRGDDRLIDLVHEQSGGLGRSVDPCRVDRASGIGKD